MKDDNYDYEGCLDILVNSKINWTRIINKQVNSMAHVLCSDLVSDTSNFID